MPCVLTRGCPGEPAEPVIAGSSPFELRPDVRMIGVGEADCTHKLWRGQEPAAAGRRIRRQHRRTGWRGVCSTCDNAAERQFAMIRLLLTSKSIGHAGKLHAAEATVTFAGISGASSLPLSHDDAVKLVIGCNPATSRGGNMPTSKRLKYHGCKTAAWGDTNLL